MQRPRLTKTARPRGKCVWGRTGRVLASLLLAIVSTVATANAQVHTLSWDANTDPFTVGYRVHGGNAPGQYGWSVDVGSATSAVLPDLTPDTPYYFVVRAYNQAGEVGPASAELSFTRTGRPGSPQSLSAAITGSTVSLSWAPPASGIAPSYYLVSVGTAPGAVDLVNALSVGSALSVSGGVVPGRYYARVQAVNAYGAGPVSDEISFVAGGIDQPGNPTGLSVRWNGTVATLAWSPGAGATTYYLEAGSAPGAADLARVNVGPVTRYVVDVPGGVYYVRVRAASSTAVSGPSNEIVVQGRGAPERPTSLTAAGTNGVVDLRWFAPTTGPQPTGYLLEAGSAPGLANLATLQVGPQTRFTATAPPGVYYVRVRALNARGASLPSNEIIVRR